MPCPYTRFRVIPCSHYDDVKFFKNSYKVVQYGCGKCAECTKSRQNDIAVRAAYEAMNYNDITFVRLSYNNQTIPLSFVPYLVFPDGTKIQDGQRELYSGDELPFMRAEMAKIPNSIIKGKSRYLHYRVPGMDDVKTPGSYVEYVITPSVDLRDPRLWLKACRVAFKREFGYSLPDFKYLMCSEYGEQYTRPHYHYLFLGLKYWMVDWMCKRWQSQYGFTTIKRVNNGPKDKFRVASYISKYMAKGDFEVPAVKAGIAIKGRYCASRALGKYVIENKQPHFLAFDLFGRYDPDTLRFESGVSMSEVEIKMVVDEIIKRMSVTVPGADYRFPLPQSWKYALYYRKVPRMAAYSELIIESDDERHLKIHFSNSYRYVPFKVFRFVQKTLQDRIINDDLRQLQEFVLSLPSGCSYTEANFRFKNFKKVRAESAESHAKETLRSFYSKDAE